MKKFLNKPENFVDEFLEGILIAHPDKLEHVQDDLRCIVTKNKQPGRVAIATGGGSGHLPLFLGYVGDGVIDGCSVGGVFQSPSAEQMYNVTKHIDNGAGVLYLYGNYGGDIMNFDMAAEMADMDDIRVESFIAADDVASAPKGEEGKRRGVAGIFFLYKVAGAKADKKASLDEVKAVVEKAASGTRTMGVALTPCIVPEVGKPSFQLGENEMEIGMGIHGEPGIRRGEIRPADEVVDEMMEAIVADLPYKSGDEVSVLINGLGATPKEELYLVNRRVAQFLKEKEMTVYRTFVDEFAASLEMAGFSISLMKMDGELKELIDAPANTPFYAQHSCNN
ncbi:MAG: dihydroxyacetone kinase subunit DhaK [Spirochaetales bacterium]|nr:dihydroxyacetone kinase subunit DhaK [Spirochaetales bacterium]MCF7937006.1 dihydroxyacetone kinase subunit DhaK [Spirochaetales bacterium]